MKRLLYLASLLLLASCQLGKDKGSVASMDADFIPTDPHPFTKRISEGIDTLGEIVVNRSDADTTDYLLHEFTFLTEGISGTADCRYNEFNELIELWIKTADRQTHSRLQWDENGNIQGINSEIWVQDSLSTHQMICIEFKHSHHSAYGNWYARTAETVGGPIAALFHEGRLGRAPWTLPESISFVYSDIRGNMIGEQHTCSVKPIYTFDNNGRVTQEVIEMPDNKYQYTYIYN